MAMVEAAVKQIVMVVVRGGGWGPVERVKSAPRKDKRCQCTEKVTVVTTAACNTSRFGLKLSHMQLEPQTACVVWLKNSRLGGASHVAVAMAGGT